MLKQVALLSPSVGSYRVIAFWTVQVVLQEEVEDHLDWRPGQDQPDTCGAARAAVALPRVSLYGPHDRDGL